MATPTRTLSPAWPIHARLTPEGGLELGGVDAAALARDAGTPVYVLVEDDLRERARAFSEALAAHHDGPGEILFASKALPVTAVYRLFAEEGLSVDVASGGELHTALAAGVPAKRIHVHGNAKSRAELRAAVAAGVGTVIVDGFHDLERLLEEADPARPQAVLLRVTPDVAGATHASISTGQRDSKFGFQIEEAPRAIERAAAAPGVRLEGLHVHIGSQILDLDPLRRAVAALAPLGDFPTYNLGGGLGVAYGEDEDPPSVPDYVAALAATADAELGRGKRLLVEPGRALVANAGVTLYEVQTVKHGPRRWVAADGGMSDNLRPMLYGARHEAEVVGRFGGDTPCRLVGKHCESGDVIVGDVALDDPRPGDLIAVAGTGAYGHAMANNYNGVPRPPVVFASGGRWRTVVRRESYDDLLARDLL